MSARKEVFVTGTIFNIQKFCLHDGDGIRTNVFLKGCPLKCIWCHNPEGLFRTVSLSFTASRCTLCGRCLRVCPARRIEDGALKIDREQCTHCGRCVDVCLNDANELLGKEVSADEVMSDVLKDRMFYERSGGGLTVSGGEPSYQPEFTLELLKRAKAENIGIAIETCGAGPRWFFEKAADLGTTFLYDLKCMDPERHRELTGADNKTILDNLDYLFSRGADVVIRLPMIPGMNDRDEDIGALCAFLKEHVGKYRYAEIMPYHTLGTGKDRKLGNEPRYEAKAADEEDKKRWRARFEENGVQVRISE